MGWRIVKQPDGKFARWSDIVDNFTAYDMTREEAIEHCLELFRGEATAKVQRGDDDEDPRRPGVKGNGLLRWKDCVETMKRIHGPKASAVQLKEMGFPQ